MEITIGQEPPFAGTDIEALLGSLDRMRGYLLWKCSGLDDVGIRQTLGPSTLTLGGLLKHAAVVEAITLAWKLHGRRPFPPFGEADWDDQDWHLRVEDDDTPESLERLFVESVAQGKALVDEAIAAGGLDFAAAMEYDGGRHPSLRRLLFDLVEEYGRHVGHADLIRESIDGLVGEDPAPGSFPGTYNV
jgi:hypothetical protein